MTGAVPFSNVLQNFKDKSTKQYENNMLRQILSITGRPGLFKIVSQGNRSLIVEDITTGKRFPALARDKVVSLGDIAMYTDSEDLPLGKILDRVYARYEGKPVDVKTLQKEGGLREAFAGVVPDFDRDRVYDNDIKKLFNWYNLLIAAGYNKFEEEQAAEVDTPAE